MAHSAHADCTALQHHVCTAHCRRVPSAQFVRQDATLFYHSGKSGRVETTPLYRQIYQAAGDIKPINISLDPLARIFAGNEMDRTQVYGLVGHAQALALAPADR